MNQSGVRKYEYDIAFSFAGEQRDYVETVKIECERLGLRVFYDQDKKVELRGENVVEGLRRVYGGQARHVVAFFSGEYLEKPMPRDELRAATDASLRGRGGYILPIIMGKVVITPDRLPLSTGYLKAEDFDPSTLAVAIQSKLNGMEMPIPNAKDVAMNTNTSPKPASEADEDTLYSNRMSSGGASFDYSNNNGGFSIGHETFLFETKWSKASDRSIHCYNDPPSIAGLAIAKCGPHRRDR